jgi:hypothetical protein
MLLVDWYRIDWVQWGYFTVSLGLGLVLLLRFLRVKFRWGSVDAKGIEMRAEEVSGCNVIRYVLDGEHRCPGHEPPPKLLLLPPMVGKPMKAAHLAVALAFLGFEVCLVHPRQLSHKNWEPLTTLVATGGFSRIIAFDLTCPAALNALATTPSKVTQFVGIRPLLGENPLSLMHVQPMSTQFLYLVAARLKGLDVPQCNLEDVPVNLQCSFLVPNGTMGSESSLAHLKGWTRARAGDVLELPRGGWTFFGQETLVLGWLSRVLGA